ncbi:hypothetical protein WA158_000186 [Blastocystis sp. Blastoise]
MDNSEQNKDLIIEVSKRVLEAELEVDKTIVELHLEQMKSLIEKSKQKRISVMSVLSTSANYSQCGFAPDGYSPDVQPLYWIYPFPNPAMIQKSILYNQEEEIIKEQDEPNEIVHEEVLNNKYPYIDLEDTIFFSFVKPKF